MSEDDHQGKNLVEECDQSNVVIDTSSKAALIATFNANKEGKYCDQISSYCHKYL